MGNCTPPLPVYFHAPIGVKQQGFDTTLAGNYFPLDDIIEKGSRDFMQKYTVRYDRIYRIGTEPANTESGLDYREIGKITGNVQVKDTCHPPYPEPNCDSLMRTFCKMNDLAASKWMPVLDRPGKSASEVAMLKITYDQVLFISLDSAGRTRKDTLFTLGPDIVLTRLDQRYFLNFRSEWGWEYLQLETWEGRFLGARPFIFTGYNTCAKNEAELTASTRYIYPGLKPCWKGKTLVGYKATAEAAKVLEAFRKAEGSILLVKLKP